VNGPIPPIRHRSGDLSHEVRHALWLEDRYDCSESRGANQDMNVEMRLHWFVKQNEEDRRSEGPVQQDGEK
jgi:hypothetical protein